MRIAIYPGSFNPWHHGHVDILNKALKCFDKVIVSIGYNPEKTIFVEIDKRVESLTSQLRNYKERVEVKSFKGFLVKHINDVSDESENKICAVIRGLRNGHDLQYEMNQQYWNEDLGLTIPVVYFICDRKLSHISSSAMRMIGAVNK